jgi:uncharacterized Zn finger protein (UPF0148 family)
MAKSLKLRELLLQSDEEKKSEDVEYRVKQAELQLESDILATKQSLDESKKERAELVLAEPLDADSIIQKDIEIESLEDGLKRLNLLKEELF